MKIKKQFKKLIAILLAFLIITSSLTLNLENADAQVTSDQPLDIERVEPAEDILINVAELQPTIVPQQAFETDDYIGYPVYALLYGIQTNPFIDVSKIRSISFRTVNTNVPGVLVSPRPPPYGRYTLDNMGMLIIKLPKIKDERKIPKRVDINISANILYDIGSGFGVTEVGKSIKQITEQEFTQDKAKYSFWSGRGYVKADLIEDYKATFSLYDGRLQKVRSITLLQGQESSEISLATGYFFPSIGEEALRRNLRDRFKLRLDSIDVPRDKAKLQVLVNNRLISQELKVNERLYEGSAWKVSKIEKTNTQDIVWLLNEDTKETVPLTGSRSYINCADYKTKELCELFKEECTFDEKENKCMPKVITAITTTSTSGTTDFWKLVVVAALEDTDSQGRADVAQSVYNRLAAGEYGSTIGEILTKPGQYQSVFDNPRSTGAEPVSDVFKQVTNKDTAIKSYIEQKKKINDGRAPSLQEATKEIEDTQAALINLNYQREAASFVESRTDFRTDKWDGAAIVERNKNDNAFGFDVNKAGYRKFYNPSTNLIAPAAQAQQTTQVTQVSTAIVEAEKELVNTIKEFNELKPSSSAKEFTDVVDKFVSIIKKYQGTSYDKTSRDFLYINFANKIYQDINVKKEVQDYIAKRFKEIGFKVEIKEETAIVKDSKYYYKKAIEDYKNVANYKGQVPAEQDKALEAQRKIAELYDYYLNEAENAIAAYQDLINSYNLSELEKITYESRIEFLRDSTNYATQPIDIYEDGNLIRVILNGVEGTAIQPVAFISLDDKDATAFKEGDYLQIEGKKTSWKIERIEGNKVSLVSDNINLLGPDHLRDQLFIDTTRILDNVKVKLVKIDTKKEARITILPVLKTLTSISNFQVHIPIERRLIKLSDEQIDSQVEFTRKTVNTLNSIINRVEKIYEVLSYYCYTIFSYLFLKNLLLVSGSRHLARQQVMEKWEIYCKGKDKYAGVDDCISQNRKEIVKDIDNMQKAVKRTDKAFELIKNAKVNDKCDDLQLGSLETDKEFSDLSKLDLNLLKEYCNIVKLDAKKEVINEGELRANLLQREKSTFNYEKATEFSPYKDGDLRKFIEQDRNLRHESELKKFREDLFRETEIKDAQGEIKKFEDLEQDVKRSLKEMYGTEIEKHWDNKEIRLSTANGYIDGKVEEKYQEEFKKIKDDDLKYYTGVIPSVPKDQIEKILLEKQKLENKIDLTKQAQSPGLLNLDIGKVIDETSEPRPRNLRVTNQKDWYSNDDLIYVAIVEKKDGKDQVTVLTFREFLEDKEKKYSDVIRNFGEDNNIKELSNRLKEKNLHLTIEQNGKYKVIDIGDAIFAKPETEYEIRLENNKLKTITVNYNHYLEAERNSQGLITNVRLWRIDYNKQDKLIDTLPINECSKLVETNVGREFTKACSELQKIDRAFIANPEKTKQPTFDSAGTQYKLKGAGLKSGVLECTNIMDPDDCLLLFSACDPVMCPPSRFTYKGYSVDNVVASGISGSVFLGLGLWRSPYLPFTGGEIGICVPGILAGLKNIRSILQGYEQCLLVKKEEGENVGICDTIFNIGICRVAWREAYAFFNIERGLLGAFLKWVSPSGTYGGNEYAFFYENVKKTTDFVSFFTNEYATTFFNAFRGSSTQEIGDTICEYAIYGKLPGGGTLLEQLTRPEGPPQFTAIMDEVPHANVGLQQTSDYSVFYHIYAGESFPQVRYYVYLHDIDEKISPATLAIAPRFGLSGVTTGYLNRGDFVSDTVRLSDLPTGYDEVCVVINNVKKCGFGKVSSDFAVQYAQDQIIKDQFAKNATSASECVPDNSLISQFSGASTLQFATAIGGLAFGSGLSSSGVVRKCSAIDPNLGTNNNRWIARGTCGKDSQGRDLGTCWVDKNSLNLLSENVRQDILKSLEDTNKLKSLLKELDNLKGDSSFGLINRIQNEIKKVTGKDKNVYKEFNEQQKSIYNSAQQICGVEIKEDTDVNTAISLMEAALRTYIYDTESCKKILNEMYDLRNKIKQLREQSIESLTNEATRLVNRYIKEILEETIDAEISQPAYFSIGEIHENIAHLLRADETRERKLARETGKAQEKSKEKEEEVQKGETKSPPGTACIIEYEEGNSPLKSDLIKLNFYYRFNNGRWETKLHKDVFDDENKFNPETKEFLSNFKNWRIIDDNLCKLESFKKLDSAYQKVCNNLKDKNLDDGMGYLSFISNKQDDDYLIIHNSKTSARTEIKHAEASVDKINKICSGEKEGQTSFNGKKIEIRFALASNQFGFIGDLTSPDVYYIWDGKSWYTDTATSSKTDLKLSYDEGLTKINKEFERWKEDRTIDIKSTQVKCGDGEFQYLNLKQDIIKQIDDKVKEC